MDQACCFDGGTCRNTAPEECLQAGGLPMGNWSWCSGTVPPQTGYHLIACAYEACCWIIDLETHEKGCSYTPRNYCESISGGLGGDAMGWGTWCAPGFNCNDEYDDYTCCLADGTAHIQLTYNQCLAIGGDPRLLELGEECPRPEIDDDCRYAEPDRYPAGFLHWHRDVCQNVILMETRRHLVQEPLSGSRYFRKGYFELVTRQETRAMAPDDENDPCRHQFAPVIIDADGYATGAVCTDRAIEGLTRSVTVPVVAKENDQYGKVGYTRFYSSAQTPFWTEVIFDSPLLTCGGGER